MSDRGPLTANWWNTLRKAYLGASRSMSVDPALVPKRKLHTGAD